MTSRRNFSRIAFAMITIMAAGTVAASDSSCAWGAGSCGATSFGKSFAAFSRPAVNANSGWKFVGPNRISLPRDSSAGFAKAGVTLAPVVLPVTPRSGKASLPVGWSVSGGPKWNQNGGNNGRPVMVGAVPEPETWLIMMAGVGALGWVARRRSRAMAAS